MSVSAEEFLNSDEINLLISKGLSVSIFASQIAEINNLSPSCFTKDDLIEFAELYHKKTTQN